MTSFIHLQVDDSQLVYDVTEISSISTMRRAASQLRDSLKQEFTPADIAQILQDERRPPHGDLKKEDTPEGCPHDTSLGLGKIDECAPPKKPWLQ